MTFIIRVQTQYSYCTVYNHNTITLTAVYLGVDTTLIVKSVIDDPCKVSRLVQSSKNPLSLLVLFLEISQRLLEEAALLVPHIPWCS